MDDPMNAALLISAVGMALLFLALLLFYGLIVLLGAFSPQLTSSGRDNGAGHQVQGPPRTGSDSQRRALAAAVAVALARSVPRTPPGHAELDSSEQGTRSVAPSAWWTVYQQQRLSEDSALRRRT